VFLSLPKDFNRRAQTIIAAMTLQLLGGMTVKQFLSRHWQKRPLLVREAIPDFKGIIQPAELARLALRDDVESRAVWRSSNRWHLRHGPFLRSELRARQPRWTVLVQGVNLHDSRVDALMQRFAFIPYARLDDVMVSFATPGGGVGPHLDSYDVFLLQGQGRRRWRIGRARDKALVPDAPLKVLRRFTPEHEWVLGPGDMLYLPPGWAHDGVAVDSCTTYSIGFRAPTARELAGALLAATEEQLAMRASETRYADSGAPMPGKPGRIPESLAAFAQRAARSLVPRPADIDRALGQYLSEPKAHVVFDRPTRALSRGRFLEKAKRTGVVLDPRSRLLYRGGRFFINGEPLDAEKSARAMLTALADARSLPPAALARLRRGSQNCERLHRWYAAGWLHPK
jgi:50S ribosomal protein L16 3-hydroxylase